MRCLCCNKILNDDGIWHKSCIKRFFNSPTIPIIHNEIEGEVLENIKKKKGVTGVQPKLSYSNTITSTTKKMTSTFNGEYIIKPNTKKYKEIAQCEYIVMTMAKACNINVPSFGLIKDDNDNYVYIIKRYDRDNNNKIHVEDFAQLLGVPTENKYQGSYEQCAKKVIEVYSDMKIMDKVDFFTRVLFSYITLNSDMHLKNFSIIENEKNQLSPQYDLLPVKLIFNDSEDLALTLNGKKKNIKRNDFIKFGENIGVIKPERIIDNMLEYENEFIEIINESLLSNELKEKFIIMLQKKYNKLKKYTQ